MGEVEIDRTLTQMVHQILERNQGSLDLILIGIRNRRAPLAHRIGRKLHQIEGISIPVGSVDVTLYRDDTSRRIPRNKPRKSDIPFIVTDKKVVLVDDVLQTPIINAGDGAHQHPTQALLDLFTIRERKQSMEGLKVAIVGDISHSRVARSNVFGMTMLGMEVSVATPATMLPLIPPQRAGLRAQRNYTDRSGSSCGWRIYLRGLHAHHQPG